MLEKTVSSLRGYTLKVKSDPLSIYGELYSEILYDDLVERVQIALWLSGVSEDQATLMIEKSVNAGELEVVNGNPVAEGSVRAPDTYKVLDRQVKVKKVLNGLAESKYTLVEARKLIAALRIDCYQMGETTWFDFRIFEAVTDIFNYQYIDVTLEDMDRLLEGKY